MRMFLFALALLAVTPATAQTTADTAHLSEGAGLRVLHGWTPATAAGSDALIFMEIENTGTTEAMLTGGMAGEQALELVGFSYGAAGEAWTTLPGLPIAAGATLHLEPKGLALRWPALPQPLTPGADLAIDLSIGGQRLTVVVAVEDADATAHSHAGHGH